MFVTFAFAAVQVCFSSSVVSLKSLGSWPGESTKGMQVRTVGDSLAFTAGVSNGLVILDTKNPSAINELGSIGMNSSLALPWGSDRVLLASADHGPTYVVDVKDPLKPALIDSIVAPEGLGSVEVDARDSLVYSAVYNPLGGGLGIYRLGYVGRVKRVGYISLSGNVWSVAVRDTLAVVSAGTPGLHIVSIKDSSKPVLLSTAAVTSGHAFEAVWKGSQVWAVSTDGYVHGFDVSNPRKPVKIASVSLQQGAGRRIAINKDFLFVTSASGFSVLDISNPASVSIVAKDVGSALSGVSLSDSLAYVMSEWYGLQIYKWKVVARPKLISPIGDVYRQSKPRFVWSKGVATSSDFELKVSLDSTFSKVTISLPVTDTEFVSPSVLASGRWFWKVQRSSDSISSIPGAFVIWSDSIPLVHPFKGIDVGALVPSLVWDRAVGFDSIYKVQLSTVRDFSVTLSFPTRDSLLDYPMSIEKGLWYWRVLAGSKVSPIDSFVIGRDSVVGIRKMNNRDGFVMWSEGDVLNFRTPNMVSVYDLQGKLLCRNFSRDGIVKIRVDGREFNRTGLYFAVSGKNSIRFALQ